MIDCEMYKTVFLWTVHFEVEYYHRPKHKVTSRERCEEKIAAGSWNELVNFLTNRCAYLTAQGENDTDDGPYVVSIGEITTVVKGEEITIPK